MCFSPLRQRPKGCEYSDRICYGRQVPLRADGLTVGRLILRSVDNGVIFNGIAPTWDELIELANCGVIVGLGGLVYVCVCLCKGNLCVLAIRGKGAYVIHIIH